MDIKYIIYYIYYIIHILPGLAFQQIILIQPAREARGPEGPVRWER